MDAQPSDSEIRAALQAYFRVLQSNPTAEEMRRTVVTNDFQTGFAGWLQMAGAKMACMTFLPPGPDSWTNNMTSTRFLHERIYGSVR